MNWSAGFTIGWSTHCGCSIHCYHYTLFHRSDGKTRLLKRFFGVKKDEYFKLIKELIKYFKYEYTQYERRGNQ